jgi:hypothetical protein
MSGSASAINVVNGDLSLLGTSQGTGTGNHGIRLESGASLSVTETGAMTLNGTSGRGDIYNCGCSLLGSTGTISTREGLLTIVGVSQGVGSQNYGVDCEGIELSSTSGGLSLTGTAGTGEDKNTGVYLSGTSTELISESGDILITGTGGSGTGDSAGVALLSGAISSTGSGDTAAKITIMGTGGTGGDENDGISCEGEQGVIVTVDGEIVLQGTAGSGDSSIGVDLQYPDNVYATGSGTVTVDSN